MTESTRGANGGSSKLAWKAGSLLIVAQFGADAGEDMTELPVRSCTPGFHSSEGGGRGLTLVSRRLGVNWATMSPPSRT